MPKLSEKRIADNAAEKKRNMEDAPSVRYKNQTDEYNAAYRKWRSEKKISMGYVRTDNPNELTYKDGVGGTAFADQVHPGLKLGDATPGFTGTPYRWNYTFTGWKPAVAPTVSGDAVYTAQWSYNGGGWTPSYPINPVPPVVVVPPKTGDMPFWYSIAQFLGLVK